MRKRVILAFVLVLALLASTGCSLIIKDEEVDRQTPIIEVAGKTITKGEVLAQAEYVMDYYEYMYSMYGMSYDRTSATAVAGAREEAINGLVQNAVLEQKIAENGFDTFTEEEEADILAAAQESYDTYAETVKTFAFADTELTGEELDAAVAEQMVAYGYGTLDDLVANERATRSRQKLRDETVKDVAVSEEELTTEYNTRVETDKANYGDNPDSYDYGAAVTNGTTVYYTPAGYRTVKQILLQFAEDDQTAIDDLNKQLTSKQSELTTAQNSLNDLGEDASADDEATAETRATLTASVETLTADVEKLQSDLDAAREAGYTALQPTVDEIQAKLTEGASFDSLIETYNQDPGMTENGYLVSENSRNWVTEFKDASMALAAVGDVSDPVRTTYGIHLIEYASDVAEGEIGLETVRDTLSASLLSEKQTAAYNEAVEKWVEEANAKIDSDKL